GRRPRARRADPQTCCSLSHGRIRGGRTRDDTPRAQLFSGTLVDPTLEEEGLGVSPEGRPGAVAYGRRFRESHRRSHLADLVHRRVVGVPEEVAGDEVLVTEDLGHVADRGTRYARTLQSADHVGGGTLSGGLLDLCDEGVSVTVP